MSDATRHGMRDSEDAIISSYKFAKHYSKHLLEIAHRKNTEYSSVGVLDTNDLVNLVSLCFTRAWDRVDWESINKMPEGGAKQAQLWSFLKKTITLDLGHEIRYIKDGIRIPHSEHLRRLAESDGKNFNAISSLFPQLKLEMSFADAAIEETEYFNDFKIDALNEVFIKFLNPKERSVLEMSLGVDRDKMSLKEISEELGMKEKTVSANKIKALKKLKEDDARKYLAFLLEGKNMGDKTCLLYTSPSPRD